MKKLHKYLSVYASASVSITYASVVYTDTDPDIVLNVNDETFNVDFNNDGNPEYRIIMEIDRLGGGGWGPDVYAPRINGANGNDIAGYYLNGGGWGNPLLPASFALPYYEGSTVSSNMNWEGSSPYFGYYFYGNYGIESNGAWNDLEDRFLALKFNLNGETHYGWVRCDVDYNYKKVTVKDFAYNDSPNEPIEMGVTYEPTLVADSIIASDISNNGNGLDLKVSFNKASNQSGIKEYRLYAVKSSKADKFTLGTANSSPYYKSVAKGGARLETTFNESSKDTDGELIAEGKSYNVFVLSVPDFENLYNSNLSEPSNEITLENNVGINKNAFDKVTYFINNNRLIVTSENYIMEYIRLTDVSGKIVFSNQTQSKNYQIDLSNQSKGLLLAQIEINGVVQTKKVIL